MDYGVKACGWLRYSTPDGSTTAGPKSVTRAIGTANLRRVRDYVLWPMSTKHHFHGCQSAASTCFAC